MKILKPFLLQNLLLSCLLLVNPLAHAQITLPGGTVLSGPGSTALKVCDVHACFRDEAAKAQYENQNNCKFLAKGLCGDKPFDDAKQCCGKDAKTGSAKVKDRQIAQIDSKFDWAAYQKECPNMRQSEAGSDDLWKQCVVGKKHDLKDDWNVIVVQKNAGSPNARNYCIDGCSTPPGAVTAAYVAGIFLENDKDNPSGYPGASFFQSCASHDVCYQSCGKGNDQLTCDNQLLSDSKKACNAIPKHHYTESIDGPNINTFSGCINAANKMYFILSDLNLGTAAFNKRKQQYCQCC